MEARGAQGKRAVKRGKWQSRAGTAHWPLRSRQCTPRLPPSPYHGLVWQIPPLLGWWSTSVSSPARPGVTDAKLHHDRCWRWRRCCLGRWKRGKRCKRRPHMAGVGFDTALGLGWGPQPGGAQTPRRGSLGLAADCLPPPPPSPHAYPQLCTLAWHADQRREGLATAHCGARGYMTPQALTPDLEKVGSGLAAVRVCCSFSLSFRPMWRSVFRCMCVRVHVYICVSLWYMRLRCMTNNARSAARARYLRRYIDTLLNDRLRAAPGK